MTSPLVPAGLCGCGCGQPTLIVDRNDPIRGYVAGSPRLYRRNHHPRAKGPAHPLFRGARTITIGGYVSVYAPENPRANAKGYVLEHILVVERAMGKHLRLTAEVHHVDRSRKNNATSNLVACHDDAYHKLLHQRQNAMDACGDPNALRCQFCRTYDRQSEIVVTTRRGTDRKPGGLKGHHRDCEALYRRDLSRRNAKQTKAAS
jgi:hypothetical protein